MSEYLIKSNAAKTAALITGPAGRRAWACFNPAGNIEVLEWAMPEGRSTGGENLAVWVPHRIRDRASRLLRGVNPT